MSDLAIARFRRLRRVLPAAVVVLALAAAACGRTEPATATATSPERAAPPSTTLPDTSAPAAGSTVEGIPDDWQPAPLSWGPCVDVDVDECATLDVPLDWSEPDGTTIELGLGRIPARGSAIGPLLMNPGGPGASGLEFLQYAPVSPDVLDRFDLVSWDPRGIGASTPLACGTGSAELFSQDPSPDDPTEQASLDAAAQAISSDCAAETDMLEHIGTWNVARDMEAIRRALGAPPLNYIGFSYGTHIGQAYAEMFPANIRAMVLDGVVDPALGFEEFLLGQTTAFGAAFERNAESCARAGRAACGVDDLGAAFDEVMAALETAPLGTTARPVGPGELGTAAVATSYSPDGWKRLGPALRSALAGDGAKVRSLAESYLDFGSYSTYAGVVCTDSPPPTGEAYRAFVAQAEAISPRFGAGVANEMLPCATWPVAATGEPMAITAPGAPPILVVGNTGDAATPYENAVAVAERLTSGVLVSADIEGHTAYGANECVTRVVDDYLIRLVVPTSDPACT